MVGDGGVVLYLSMALFERFRKPKLPIIPTHLPGELRIKELQEKNRTRQHESSLPYAEFITDVVALLQEKPGFFEEVVNLHYPDIQKKKPFTPTDIPQNWRIRIPFNSSSPLYTIEHRILEIRYFNKCFGKGRELSILKGSQNNPHVRGLVEVWESVDGNYIHPFTRFQLNPEENGPIESNYQKAFQKTIALFHEALSI